MSHHHDRRVKKKPVFARFLAFLYVFEQRKISPEEFRSLFTRRKTDKESPDRIPYSPEKRHVEGDHLVAEGRNLFS